MVGLPLLLLRVAVLTWVLAAASSGTAPTQGSGAWLVDGEADSGAVRVAKDGVLAIITFTVPVESLPPVWRAEMPQREAEVVDAATAALHAMTGVAVDAVQAVVGDSVRRAVADKVEWLQTHTYPATFPLAGPACCPSFTSPFGRTDAALALATVAAAPVLVSHAYSVPVVMDGVESTVTGFPSDDITNISARACAELGLRPQDCTLLGRQIAAVRDATQSAQAAARRQPWPAWTPHIAIRAAEIDKPRPIGVDDDPCVMPNCSAQQLLQRVWQPLPTSLPALLRDAAAAAAGGTPATQDDAYIAGELAAIAAHATLADGPIVAARYAQERQDVLAALCLAFPSAHPVQCDGAATLSRKALLSQRCIVNGSWCDAPVATLVSKDAAISALRRGRRLAASLRRQAPMGWPGGLPPPPSNRGNSSSAGNSAAHPWHTWAQAVAWTRLACRYDPLHASSQLQLGRLLMWDAGAGDGAAAHLRQAVLLSTAAASVGAHGRTAITNSTGDVGANALWLHAYILHKQRDYVACVNLLRQALELAPQDEELLIGIHNNLGVAFELLGRSVEAMRHLHQSAVLSGSMKAGTQEFVPPLPVSQLNADTLFPFFHDSFHALVAAVHRSSDALSRRLRWAQRHNSPRSAAAAAADEGGSACLVHSDKIGTFPAMTNLAYTGAAVRPLLERLMLLYHELCPAAYSHPGMEEPPHNGMQDDEAGVPDVAMDVRLTRRVRVGFLCQHYRGHTLTRLLGGVVARLASSASFGVHVYLLTQPKWYPDDSVAQSIAAAFHTSFVTLPAGAEQAKRAVLDLDLDVLVYTDVGMEPWSLGFAASRLARSQVLVLNNGQTSGLPATMDWYLSSWGEQPDNTVAEALLPLPVDHITWPRSLQASAARRRRFQAAQASGMLSIASHTSAGVAGEDRRAAARHYSETLYMFPADVSISYHLLPNSDLARTLGGMAFTGINASAPSAVCACATPRNMSVVRHIRAALLMNPNASDTSFRLYGVPQSLPKFHPSFDGVLLGVLERDPAAALVVLGTKGRANSTLLPRLQATATARWCTNISSSSQGEKDNPEDDLALPRLPPVVAAPPPAMVTAAVDCTRAARRYVAQRLVMLPRVPHADFVHMLSALDVALDLWPFGGGFTTFETLVHAHTPVVTLPSGTRSGRLTLALLRRLGIHQPDEGFVATTGDDLVHKAVHIAMDSAWSASRRARLCHAVCADKEAAGQSSAVFQNEEVAAQWVHFLRLAAWIGGAVDEDNEQL